MRHCLHRLRCSREHQQLCAPDAALLKCGQCGAHGLVLQPAASGPAAGLQLGEGACVLRLQLLALLLARLQHGLQHRCLTSGAVPAGGCGGVPARPHPLTEPLCLHHTRTCSREVCQTTQEVHAILGMHQSALCAL